MAHYPAIVSNENVYDVSTTKITTISGLDSKYKTGMTYIQRIISGTRYCFGWQLVYEDAEQNVKALGGSSNPFKLYFVDGNTEAFKTYTGITDGKSWFASGNSQTDKAIMVVFNGWNYTVPFGYEGSNGSKPNNGILGVEVPNFAGSYAYVNFSHAVTKRPGEVFFSLPTVTVFANMDKDFVDSAAWLVETRSRAPSTGNIYDWSEIWKHGVNGGQGSYNPPGIDYHLIKPNLDYEQYAMGIAYEELFIPTYLATNVKSIIIDNENNSFTVRVKPFQLYDNGKLICGDFRSQYIRNYSTNSLTSATLELACYVTTAKDGTGSYDKCVYYSDTPQVLGYSDTFEYTFKLEDLEDAMPTENDLYTLGKVRDTVRVHLTGSATDFMNSTFANELEDHGSPLYPIDVSGDIKIYVRPNSPKFYHTLSHLPARLWLTEKDKPTTKYNNVNFMWLAHTAKNTSAPIAGYCVELCEVTEDGYRVIDDAAAYVTAYGNGSAVEITHKNDPIVNVTQDNADGKSGIIIPGGACPIWQAGYHDNTYYPLTLDDFSTATTPDTLNGVTVYLSKFAKYKSSWLKPGATICIHVSAYTEDKDGTRYYSFFDVDPYMEGRNGPPITIQKSNAAVGVYTSDGWVEGEVLVRIDDEWTEAEGVLIKTSDSWVEADSI